MGSFERFSEDTEQLQADLGAEESSSRLFTAATAS